MILSKIILIHGIWINAYQGMGVMTEDVVRKIDLQQFKHGIFKDFQDLIIDEDILKIFINDKECFNLVFSMVHTRELAAGMLYTQGVVEDRSEIRSIELDKESQVCHVVLDETATQRFERFRKERQTRGSSGGSFVVNQERPVSGTGTDTLRLGPGQVLSLIQQHWDASVLFHRTGAVHSAGLCSAEQILHYFEDIGRHNAVDKLAGDVVLNRRDVSDKIATLSCRMSLEIIGKLIRTGIRVVISNAAPTLSAVHLAQAHDLTVIGFARDNRFNVYTGGHRIIMDPTG